MRLQDLAPDLDLGTEGGVVVSGLTADSRKVLPGMLFAALPGSRADGAAFVADAVEGRAVALRVQLHV